jgi:excisionase family DNA binding protein
MTKTQSKQQEPNSLATSIRARKSALTAQDIADILCCKVGTVYAWVKQGTLPAMRIGGLVRFDPCVTAKWIEVHG